MLVLGGRRVIWSLVDVVLFSPWWPLCYLVLGGRCVDKSLVDADNEILTEWHVDVCIALEAW